LPALGKEKADEAAEGRRCAYLQLLAVISGIVTARLAQDFIPMEITKLPEGWAIVGLGLLASGGSGFWNSVLTYVTKVKELKKVEAVAAVKNLKG
jgi:hypothetical protein